MPLTALAVIASIILGALAAIALWRDEDDFLGGLVTAGDLQLTAEVPTWKQVTPGITAPQSGTLEATPTGFFAMPGDIVEIAVPVETYLRGDNLEGAISVALASPAAADIENGRIAVSFWVDDADGLRAAPATGEAQVGDTLPIAGLVGTDAGASASWTVTVRVEVLGDYVWSADAPTAAAGLWDAGSIDVRLTQVRTGGAP